MPRLRRISGKQTIEALEKLGFTKTRQRGSHVVMRRFTSSGATGCVVPIHKELAIGTLRGILKQAQISVEEFVENL